MRDRLAVLKTVLWTLVGVLAAITFVRFTRGLGAVTHLSDAAPWGLWIGFDVMSGVALAAGGFVLAAAVHIFGLERYRAFARPAVLTALLGYAAVVVGLIYDLGLPWRIWHPMVDWQHRSVLFEVAMCVMLYLTVLALEFAPAILEHPRFSHRVFRGLLTGLKRLTIPLVIAGIMLSTLHQSSLGSLFLITPGRLHPLWYSPILNVLFFASAVGLGLMVVVLESLFAARFFGHKVHVAQLSGLGIAASVVLWIYTALRVADLALRGVLGMAVDGSWLGALFVFELGISAIIPASLLLSKRVRGSLAGLAMAAGLTTGGMVLYRLDVSIVAFARPAGLGYFPSWEEFAVSIGIVSAFALVFIFFVERLRVYPDVPAVAPRRRPPAYNPAAVRGLLPAAMAAPRRYSVAAVSGAVVALVVVPLKGAPPRSVPVVPARTVDGLVVRLTENKGRQLHLAAASGQKGERKLLLLIDGNRNDDAVLFDHAGHVDRLGGDTSCAMCHHLNLPLDRASGCAECHSDMYQPVSVFNHDTHIAALGGNAGCSQCHGADGTHITYQTATACADCHRGQIAQHPIIAAPKPRWQPAVGYTDAMHGLCIACHLREVKEHADKYPVAMTRCAWCHDVDRGDELRRLLPHLVRTAHLAPREP